MSALKPCPQRLYALPDTDAAAGTVFFSWTKGLWFLGYLAIALSLAPILVSWEAILCFVALTGLTLCCGHSVGLHRLLIHRSFGCPKWLERILVSLGTLVGMGGPFGMLYLHELRDWAQKRPESHDLFGHRRSWWVDAWWQLCGEIRLDVPPVFQPEPEVAEDRFYQFLQRTWMLQQLPVAALLFAIGGVGAVAWGISLRIVVSLTGHWLIGYLAHNGGEEHWRVEGASVQGYNVQAPGLGLLTMGESWHNNHHAFPRSARLGHDAQTDLGWWFVRILESTGLAWDLQTPETLPARAELVTIRTSRPGDQQEPHQV